MLKPLLQISLKVFIHSEVTRKHGYEFTDTRFAFIDDFTSNVETLRTNYFQKSICALKYEVYNLFYYTAL